MKKLLFSALIAVAAIGGATAFPVYNSSSEKIGDCIEATPDPDCSLQYGSLKDSQGNTIPFEQLDGLDFEPVN